jgi:hypothetical protein
MAELSMNMQTVYRATGPVRSSASYMRHAEAMPVSKTSARGVKMTVALLFTAATLALAGCSGGSDPKTTPDPDKGTAEKIVEISALTGTPMPDGRPPNPVFIVKIENTYGGEPQIGLNKADMVIEELVEGGLTRLAAFFYSDLPTKVGHVRSMRTTDIGLAAPVGGQVIASGGANKTYREVKKAGTKIFSEDHGAPGFSSDPSKSRPYNRLINLQTVAKKAKPTTIVGPYFTWTPANAKKTEPAPTDSATPTPTVAPKTATGATVRFSRGTRTEWALKGGKWVRTNSHAPASSDFRADTMIVMFAKIVDAGYTDIANNPVPETVVKGTGRAMIFHGNQVIEATWSKPDLSSTISFTGADGQPITIDPGHVFVELTPQGNGTVKLR